MNGDRSGTAGDGRVRRQAKSLHLALAVVAGAALLPVAGMAAEGGLKADSSTCLLRPRHTIQLGSSVFGVLTGVFVDRADTVKAGQVVAKLDTSVEEAQLALDQYRATNLTQIEADKTDMAFNQRELERRQKLAGNMFSRANDIDEYVTKVQQDKIALQKAESDLEIAKQEAARSQMQLALKIIHSPINGVVTDVKLSPGEYIYETTPIMTIAEVDPLAIDLVVPAEKYRMVKPGMVGEVHLAPPIDQTLPARVDVIDPVIDPASDTFRVRLLLPNPGNAIPAGIGCSVTLPDIGG